MDTRCRDLATMIAVGLMTCGPVTCVAQEPPNLATNGSFELPEGSGGGIPEGWFYFTSRDAKLGRSDAQKRSGKLSMKMSAQGQANASLGIAQTVSVKPKASYEFSAFVMNDPQDPLRGGAQGQLGIEWKDGKGKEIGRLESAPWARDLSRTRWELVTVKGRAPDGAVVGILAIHLREYENAGMGSYYVDDVTVTER